jgi:hypothetical protein
MIYYAMMKAKDRPNQQLPLELKPLFHLLREWLEQTDLLFVLNDNSLLYEESVYLD